MTPDFIVSWHPEAHQLLATNYCDGELIYCCLFSFEPEARTYWAHPTGIPAPCRFEGEDPVVVQAADLQVRQICLMLRAMTDPNSLLDTRQGAIAWLTSQAAFSIEIPAPVMTRNAGIFADLDKAGLGHSGSDPDGWRAVAPQGPPCCTRAEQEPCSQPG